MTCGRFGGACAPFAPPLGPALNYLFSSWPVRISILTTCAMESCTGNFLIRAHDCDV